MMRRGLLRLGVQETCLAFPSANAAGSLAKNAPTGRWALAAVLSKCFGSAVNQEQSGRLAYYRKNDTRRMAGAD
jgi:hypothetical protein